MLFEHPAVRGLPPLFGGQGHRVAGALPSRRRDRLAGQFGDFRELPHPLGHGRRGKALGLLGDDVRGAGKAERPFHRRPPMVSRFDIDD